MALFYAPTLNALGGTPVLEVSTLVGDRSQLHRSRPDMQPPWAGLVFRV